MPILLMPNSAAPSRKIIRRREAISIHIDADACPVKQEIYRAAERHKATDPIQFVIERF
jgi:hypothetical protein